MSLENIMCLDLGWRNTGVAIIKAEEGPFETTPKQLVEWDTIQTVKGQNMKDEVLRIRLVLEKLKEIQSVYKPITTIAEVPYSAQNFKGGIGVGVCWTIAAALNAEVVHPRSCEKILKEFEGSKKLPDKKDVAINFVARYLYGKAIFWNRNKMHHIADAIVAFYAYYKT